MEARFFNRAFIVFKSKKTMVSKGVKNNENNRARRKSAVDGKGREMRVVGSG